MGELLFPGDTAKNLPSFSVGGRGLPIALSTRAVRAHSSGSECERVVRNEATEHAGRRTAARGWFIQVTALTRLFLIVDDMEPICVPLPSLTDAACLLRSGDGGGGDCCTAR